MKRDYEEEEVYGKKDVKKEITYAIVCFGIIEIIIILGIILIFN